MPRLGLLVLAALLWAAPAAAQQTLYEVFGVAGGDVLNVRRSPSPQSEIVGALGPQATGIAVLQRDGDWAQVRLTDTMLGWVATRYLRRAGQFAAAPPAQLACRGTEPFWSLDIADRAVTFDLMADEAQREVSRVSRRLVSRNSPSVTAISFGHQGRDRALLRYSRICSDGMSDDLYEFEVTLLRRDGTLLSGCCRPPR